MVVGRALSQLRVGIRVVPRVRSIPRYPHRFDGALYLRSSLVGEGFRHGASASRLPAYRSPLDTMLSEGSGVQVLGCQSAGQTLTRRG